MARGRDAKGALLRNVGLLAACSDKELHAIAKLMTEVPVKEGSVLVQEGTTGREFFVIADGKAKVSVDGRKRATLGPGDFFGEMALIDQGPRTATVSAETPMSVYVLDSREFGGLLDASPTVTRKILKALAGRLRDAEKAHTH